MGKKIPDLEKVKNSLDTMERTLKDHPEIIERTQAYLSGNLKEKKLIEQSGKKAINLKVDTELIEKAEALIPKLRADLELSSFGRISVSSVIRLSILKGLELLERQYESNHEPSLARKVR
jgi:hypothetical protein